MSPVRIMLKLDGGDLKFHFISITLRSDDAFIVLELTPGLMITIYIQFQFGI